MSDLSLYRLACGFVQVVWCPVRRGLPEGQALSDLVILTHDVTTLVPPVIDSPVDFRIDGSAMAEMHRDRETSCREEICGEAER